jgi:hypothetical protein
MENQNEIDAIRQLRRSEFRDTLWRVAVWLVAIGLLLWLAN